MIQFPPPPPCFLPQVDEDVRKVFENTQHFTFEPLLLQLHKDLAILGKNMKGLRNAVEKLLDQQARGTTSQDSEMGAAKGT